ncbi:MAG: hypothetical protein ACKO14_01275 [Armatimonadota bacterium]
MIATQLKRLVATSLLCWGLACPTIAQQLPKIAAVYPAGAKTGSSVEVALRGANLSAAKELLVLGAPGVTAKLQKGGVAPDQMSRPLLNAWCSTCHEVRSADNRVLSPDAWEQTVDRMIKLRGADIPKVARDKIVDYLQASARAGVVTAKFDIAPNAPAGTREVRLVTDFGISAGFRFEVGTLPEVTANGDVQSIEVPSIVNGTLAASGQKDRYRFHASKGEKVSFNCKGYRLNEQSVSYFNPVLQIEDAKGKVVAKSLGKVGLDPLLHWTAPTDGDYTVVVRDLLWKGNPASIYRMTIGNIPTDITLTPAVGRPGQVLEAQVADGPSIKVKLPSDITGIARVATPLGDAPVLIRDIMDGGTAVTSTDLATAVTLPAMFSGEIKRSGQIDTYKVRALQYAGFELYASRMQSAMRAKVVIKNSKGEVVHSRIQSDDGDIAIGDGFRSDGEYTVEISSANGQSGPYTWESVVGKVRDFMVISTPDGINLSPGRIGALEVRASRRDGISEPIRVTVRNPPSWLRVTPAVIPPDHDRANLILEVAGDAPTGGAEIILDAVTEVPDEATPDEWIELRRRVRPQEIYRALNNNTRTVERDAAYIGVTAEQTPFSLLLEDSKPVIIKPNGEAEVRVKVLRSANYGGGVLVQFQGLPPGIEPIPFVQFVPPGQTSATFKLRANGGAGFLTKRPDTELPPFQFVFVGHTGGADSIFPYQASLPVPIMGPKTSVELNPMPKKKRIRKG